jgi:hypothetical protein
MVAFSGWAPAVAGLVIGACCGFTVRRARLCSFGAIEDAWMGGDTRRLRIFGLALAVALVGTQLMIGLDLLDPAFSTYLQPALPWFSILVGGLLFGLGMALVGTCGFGSLIRLGSGDMRSLIVTIVLGMAAYATLRGVLAPLRIEVLERVSWRVPGGLHSDLVSLASYFGASHARPVLTVLAAGALLAAVLMQAQLRRSPRLLLAGLTLGLGVVAGWWVTGVAVDPFEIVPRSQSLSFISPVGRALQALLSAPEKLIDFGIGTLAGVTLGSFASALYDRDFRWEAFDDDREMRRHLLGAMLMGSGGVLAGGCTIGQGLSAGAMLPLSWPLAIGGIMLGARVGIAFLVEGTLRGLLWQGRS